jgi:hypothetical protein
MDDRLHDDFVVRFVGVTDDRAGSFASDLRRELLDAAPGITVAHRRANSETMDFGATLGLVIGTSAATSVAHGIATWLRRNSGVSLSIETPSGTVVADNLNSANAQGIAEAVFSKKA